MEGLELLWAEKRIWDERELERGRRGIRWSGITSGDGDGDGDGDEGDEDGEVMVRDYIRWRDHGDGFVLWWIMTGVYLCLCASVKYDCGDDNTMTMKNKNMIFH